MNSVFFSLSFVRFTSVQSSIARLYQPVAFLQSIGPVPLIHRYSAAPLFVRHKTESLASRPRPLSSCTLKQDSVAYRPIQRGYHGREIRL
jgi:hypothetical protein